MRHPIRSFLRNCLGRGACWVWLGAHLTGCGLSAGPERGAWFDVTATDRRVGVVHGDYDDGKRDGNWFGAFPDGSARFEGDFERGQRIGTWNTWYPDGALQARVRYDRSGRPHGTWKTYHPNGSPDLSAQYDHGLPTGLWERRHDNGKIAFRGAYDDDGQPFGEWLHYDRTGARILSRTHAPADGPAPGDLVQGE